MSRMAALRPLAILGGTFDPIHLGHLRMAWEAAELLGAEVRLLPAHVPPHRPQPVASAAQRVELLTVALQGQQRLSIDTRELSREGPSFSIDTLLDLRSEIGPERPLVLLVGADAWSGLPSWHRWQELLDQAHIGILARPGLPRVESAELLAYAAPHRVLSTAGLLASPAGKIIELAVSALDISATRIRNDLAAGREPRYLLPQALLDDPELLAPYRPACT